MRAGVVRAEPLSAEPAQSERRAVAVARAGLLAVCLMILPPRRPCAGRRDRMLSIIRAARRPHPPVRIADFDGPTHHCPCPMAFQGGAPCPRPASRDIS